MPESLFMRRPPRRGRFVLMFFLALAFHGGLVGVAAIFDRDGSWDVKEPPVELDLADKLGDPDVRELIVADTPPPEDQPTPPPEDTPPPDDTPPPQEDPDMADPEQTPPPDTPKPAVKPKPVVKAGTPAPANAKHGPVAQEGVVGGNPNGTKTTGTPGGKTIGHWITPKPPYPQQAKMAHLQGSGSVRLTTDASGNVSSAVISGSAGSPLLDNAIQSYARVNWKGPPNASTTVPFTYNLNQ